MSLRRIEKGKLLFGQFVKKNKRLDVINNGNAPMLKKAR